MPYVNILNNGFIPYLEINGPVYGYKIDAGMFHLLSRVEGVVIELTNEELTAKRKGEYNPRQQIDNLIKEVEDRKKKEDETVTIEKLENMSWKELREFMDRNGINHGHEAKSVLLAKIKRNINL